MKLAQFHFPSAALALLTSFIAAAAPVPVYQNIAPAVSYAHVVQAEVPWSIHVAKFDYHRGDLRLTSTLGRSNIFGLRNLVTQIKNVSPVIGQPIVGINGDFFHIEKGPYQGDPHGLQIMEGELISSPEKRPSFWLDWKNQPHIGQVQSKIKVTWPDNFSVPIGINELRSSNHAALLTPRLGPDTRTTNGVEFVLERDGLTPWLPLRASQTYSARVREVRPTDDTPLASNIMVLSVGTNLANKIPSTLPGTMLKISTELAPNLAGSATAIGGWPVLIKDGIIPDHLPEAKIRAPRTAIGWNTKEFYMVVVDGRQTNLSLGMTFPELAAKMKDLGCTEALNLDGGGSTTMWVKGKVVNSPSDHHERSLGNALVLVKKGR